MAHTASQQSSSDRFSSRPSGRQTPTGVAAPRMGKQRLRSTILPAPIFPRLAAEPTQMVRPLPGAALRSQQDSSPSDVDGAQLQETERELAFYRAQAAANARDRQNQAQEIKRLKQRLARVSSARRRFVQLGGLLLVLGLSLGAHPSFAARPLALAVLGDSTPTVSAGALLSALRQDRDEARAALLEVQRKLEQSTREGVATSGQVADATRSENVVPDHSGEPARARQARSARRRAARRAARARQRLSFDDSDDPLAGLR